VTLTSPVDLAELARPFPPDFVERKDGSDYVAHHVVNQRLLSIVGPFDFELVQVIRGDVPAVAPDPSARSRRGKAGTPALSQVVVGGIWRLTATVDGRRVRSEEVGDVGDVHNWKHDGERLKDAASDALKRCAMRLGLGLHLWAQEHYFLDQQLQANARTAQAAPAPPSPQGQELADSLAPRDVVLGLLREHETSWEELAEIMAGRFPNVTVEQLKNVYKPEQVTAIRQALLDHSNAPAPAAAS
jgi:hypothetical protein